MSERARHTSKQASPHEVGAGPTEAMVPEDDAERRAQEVLRQHDTSSMYRTNLGLWGWIVTPLAVALTRPVPIP